METADLEEQLARYADWLEDQYEPFAARAELVSAAPSRRVRRRSLLVAAAAVVLLVAGLIVVQGRSADAPGSPTPGSATPASETTDTEATDQPTTTTIAIAPSTPSMPPVQTTTYVVTDPATATTIPEGAVPMAGELDPALVDVSTDGSDSHLRISFVGAAPYDPSNPCSRAYAPAVVENDEAVSIDITILGPAPTAGMTVSCIAPATPVELRVDLDAPLGDRKLTLLNTIVTLSAGQGSDVIEPDEQVYVVRTGDTVYTIAARFGITAEVLANYNSWPEAISHPLGVGDVIKIPPGSARPSDLIDGPIEHLFIGDSVALGAGEVLTDRGYTVDAGASRQLIDMVPVMQQLAARGVFGNVVVIHLGNNGPFDAATLDAFLAPLDDVPNVVILNVYADRAWTAGNNALLAERDEPGDNIILIDWAALAAECPGSCFAADGIHLNAAGMTYYADVIGDVTGL